MTFFIAYRGLGLGFLYSFFMMEYGMNGLRFALYYLFPHSLLLLPVFLLSFYKIYRRNGNHLLPFIIILYLVLLAACLLEVKFNIPLMNSLYKA